jgi:hypothetical protein
LNGKARIAYMLAVRVFLFLLAEEVIEERLDSLTHPAGSTSKL